MAFQNGISLSYLPSPSFLLNSYPSISHILMTCAHTSKERPTFNMKTTLGHSKIPKDGIDRKCFSSSVGTVSFILMVCELDHSVLFAGFNECDILYLKKKKNRIYV